MLELAESLALSPENWFLSNNHQILLKIQKINLDLILF